MELVSVEGSRVISLVRMQAKAGQPFLPHLIAAIASRYNFQKFPVSVEELTGEVRGFRLGQWNGAQIDDLQVYNDGVIVAAPAETSVNEAFLDDLYGYVTDQFGMEPVYGSVEKRLYESAIIVELSTDMDAQLSAFSSVRQQLSDMVSGYGAENLDFSGTRIDFNVDYRLPLVRRPINFTLDRRVGEPYSANRWYAMAPLKTADHIKLLSKWDASRAN